MKYLIARISCYHMKNDNGIICATIAAHDYNLMSASKSSQGYSRFTPDDIIEIMRSSLII